MNYDSLSKSKQLNNLGMIKLKIINWISNMHYSKNPSFFGTIKIEVSKFINYDPISKSKQIILDSLNWNLLFKFLNCIIAKTLMFYSYFEIYYKYLYNP